MYIVLNVEIVSQSRYLQYNLYFELAWSPLHNVAFHYDLDLRRKLQFLPLICDFYKLSVIPC